MEMSEFWSFKPLIMVDWYYLESISTKLVQLLHIWLYRYRPFVQHGVAKISFLPSPLSDMIDYPYMDSIAFYLVALLHTQFDHHLLLLDVSNARVRFDSQVAIRVLD